MLGMRFEEKLRLRRKLLASFARAGGATSGEILRADFCTFRNDPMPFNLPADRKVLIWLFRCAAKSEIGKLDGFYNRNKPDKLFVNRRELDNQKSMGRTVSHEHIHHLQDEHGMLGNLAELEWRDIKPEFKQKTETRDQTIELTGELEIMPRLHSILSTFYLMGGRLPASSLELEAFLWMCEIPILGQSNEAEGYEKYTFSVEKLLNDTDPKTLGGNLKVLGYECYEDMRDLSVGLMALKPRALPKAVDMFVSSYDKLLKLYGHDGLLGISTPAYAMA